MKHSKSVLLTLSVMTLFFLRKPDTFLNPQFWAEDGTIFFAQQFLNPFPVFHTYAGYLHLFPRLVAYVVSRSGIELQYYPLAYNLSSLLPIIIACLVIIYSRLALTNITKLVLCLSYGFVPHGGEIFLNLTNSQWILSSLLPIIYCQAQAEPFTKKQFAIDLALIILIGLSSPSLMILLPLSILSVLRSGSFLQKIKFYTIIFTSLVQFTLIFINNQAVANSSNVFIQSQDILYKNLWTFFGYLFFGRYRLLIPEYLKLPIIAFFIILIGILIYILFRFKDQNLLPILLYSSTSLYFLGLLRYPGEVLDPFVYGQRFFYLPYLFLIWIIIILHNQSKIVRFKSSLRILLYMILISCMTNFQSPKMQDMEWKYYSSLLSLHQISKIPINPPGWFIEIYRY